MVDPIELARGARPRIGRPRIGRTRCGRNIGSLGPTEYIEPFNCGTTVDRPHPGRPTNHRALTRGALTRGTTVDRPHPARPTNPGARATGHSAGCSIDGGEAHDNDGVARAAPGSASPQGVASRRRICDQHSTSNRDLFVATGCRTHHRRQLKADICSAGQDDTPAHGESIPVLNGKDGNHTADSTAPA